MNYDGGNDFVPFGVLLKYSCHKISQELIVISELLPKYKDYNRKITITEFSYMARCLLSKILAIVKWLRSYNEHQMCKEIQKFLETQEQFFRETADILCNIARSELVHARVPMYEVNAAVRLSYGKNIKLPFAIKKRFVSDKGVTNTERNKVLSIINKNILSRLSLISSILPPKIESIIIKNGMVTLTVPGEFEVTLTLFNDDISTKWTLLNIKILVEQYDIGYGTKLVHPMQLFTIHQFLQQKMTISKNPVLDLYSYLHDFCTSLQLDVLFCEISQLIGSQYKNKLIVEKYDQDAGILIISFWLTFRKKQYAPSQYKIKLFKDSSKLNNGLRVIQYPLRKNMPTLDLSTGRLSICRLLNETVLIYAREKLFYLKKKLTKLKPYTNVEVTGIKYPKIDFWLFEKSEHSEEECLSIHVNLFTGKFVLNLPFFESKSMLDELTAMINDDVSSKELEIFIRNIKMELLMHRIKKVYTEIKLPLVNKDITLKDIYTLPGDKTILARINKNDCFIVIQLTANKNTNEIIFNFFIYEKRNEVSKKVFSSQYQLVNPVETNMMSDPKHKMFHQTHKLKLFSEECERCLTKRKLWVGDYKSIRDSCYVILYEWQLTEISKAYTDGSTKSSIVKLDTNSVPHLILNCSENVSETDTKSTLSYEKCFMRLDDRWSFQKWGAFTIELFIRNVALKVDFYKKCPARENLAYKYGVKGTNIGIPCNIYWLYPYNFTQKITEILNLEKCKIMNFHKLLEDIAPHYYKFFNQYCSIKYLSNCKVIFAYGQDRRYLLYLNYFGSKVDSYKFYFGQDTSIDLVNGTTSTCKYSSNIMFNAHNNVHVHLLKWKLNKTHLHHLLLYLIKTYKPINILYSIYIPPIYSGVFVSELVYRNYQMKKLPPARLIAIDEYHIRLLFADVVIEFWIGSENNILINDVSNECSKIPGLHSLIHTYSNKLNSYNKPFFEMTRTECSEFFDIRSERFQVNSNTLKKLCLEIEPGNKYGVLIEYLHSQHILNHIKMLTKIYLLEKAEYPTILKFFNMSTSQGSISFNVQYLLLDLETREYNNISTIIYIDTNHFSLRMILNIDTIFQQQESFVNSCQKYFEKVICYNYNNLSFFGFFKLLLTPSQDVLNAIENIFRFELENTKLYNNTTISIQWVRESFNSENNSYALRSFVESNFEEGYVVIPVKISDVVVKEKNGPFDIHVFHLKYYYNTGLMEATDEEEIYPNLNSYLLNYSKEARTTDVDPFLLCLERIITNYIPVLKS
ncbi:Mediator complex, subunit Med14 family-containing protein [Strongyloides ratti]|uniref:Mediator of RNA polymerase II transcription subunit 14 n=1 Tax=Strongyloides ratti TaxID=34506 RepID=A0A090LQH5_STRRB|nr:Mediator complex, subunit Med14 family-containing protein [Strongyloides ratti]CEF69816.1 Mediator complex, subunit Med14 family-containing protein [Strongyloides ratti]